MKAQQLPLFKQQGVTLIESLVAFLIFALVLLANGSLLKDMLKVQGNSNEQMVVIDTLQERLHASANNPNAANMCAATSVDTTDFTLGSKTYHVACAIVNEDNGAGFVVEFPVLAASATSAANAQQCASGTYSDDCFVVGR
ncbi:MAG: type II secretion system protein [Venatoribacter sp.]